MKKTFLLATVLACLLSACESKLVEQVSLIPQAENVEILNGSLAVSNLQTIQTPGVWKATAENFISDVKKTAELSLALASEGASIVLTENTNLPKEAYILNITKSGVQIEASDVSGISHGLTSLHMLPEMMNQQDSKPVFGCK